MKAKSVLVFDELGKAVAVSDMIEAVLLRVMDVQKLSKIKQDNSLWLVLL